MLDMDVKQCIYFAFQVGSGCLVTVESTPSQLVEGPLADKDLALKKIPSCEEALKKNKKS